VAGIAEVQGEPWEGATGVRFYLGRQWVMAEPPVTSEPGSGSGSGSGFRYAEGGEGGFGEMPGGGLIGGGVHDELE
jgi:hypothetical protein